MMSHEFYRIRRDGRPPLIEFFAAFKKMYEEINSLLPISIDDAKMQEREQLTVMFLDALGSKFDVRLQILGSTTVPSLTDTFARVTCIL